MDPEGTVAQATSIWWLQYAWLLTGLAVLLLAASLSTQRWGSPIYLLTRRRRPHSRLTPPPRTRISFWLRTGSISTRFLGNPPLVFGSLIIGILLLGAAFPSWLAPYEPDQRGPFLMSVGDEMKAAPFPPSSTYLLGSDSRARDLLSRIIHGTRRTLTLGFVITLFRLAIGGTLGGVAGWRRGVLGHQLLSFASVSASIPSLLFAYIFIRAIGPQLGFGVFLLGLGLTGWAEMANLVNGTVRWVQSQPYMEGALAIGSSTWHIVRRHLLPNLAPQLLPAIALELSAALLTLAELGFLGIFFGERASDIVPQQMRTLNIPEWSGMLAGTRLVIFRWPWLPLGPAMTFMVAILGFNLTGIGLRGWFDPYRSRERKYQ